jgi:hypothetical protein
MSLVNPKQYIISARSNGYKDTSYAIAELADNSFQASADKVEILIFESKSRNIDQIAIVDNGKGMSKELLSSALGFGESGREKDQEGNLLNEDTQGMGKFGMGLPNASVSQCRRVEVWSWKNRQEVNYSYLDVDEIINGTYVDLPELEKKDIPDKYLNAIFDGDISEHGTLVVWSNLDKLKWKRAITLFYKSQDEIGRMYRRFISEGKCSVRFRVFDLDGKEKKDALTKLSKTGYIKANDPLYLTPNSSMPVIDSWHPDESPTFFSEIDNFPLEVEYLGSKHILNIRSSVARHEIMARVLNASKFNQAGKTDQGQDCLKNFGLSIMRANREIELITNEFFTKDDPYKARFMGVEIDIPPSLDEVFGVTNNKQHAHNLKEVDFEKIDVGDNDFKSTVEVIKYLREQGDEEQAILYQVSDTLIKVISTVRKLAKKLPTTKVNSETIEINEDDKVSIVVNQVLNKRDSIHPGKALSVEANYKELEENLVSRHGLDKTEAAIVAKKMEDLKSRISVQYSKTSNQSFFEVENLQGIAVLIINPEHELYINFLKNMQDKDKMIFKVILGAWALMEDSAPTETKKRQLERARNDWGEVIEEMFEELDLNETDV